MYHVGMCPLCEYARLPRARRTGAPDAADDDLCNRHRAARDIIKAPSHVEAMRPPRLRGACHYCGAPGLTVDHIVPKALGGPDEMWNTVPACAPCNHAKGADFPSCTCARCAQAAFLVLGR